MAIHKDGTMDVMKDGHVIQRKCVQSTRLPLINRTRVFPVQQPELFDNEDVAYYGGIPVIIPMVWPVPNRTGTLFLHLKGSV